MNSSSPLSLDLKVEDLSLDLDGHEILKDISFQVGRGQSCSIIGANGAGKTTLLKCIIKIYKPSGGAISIRGEDCNQLSQRELAKRVAYVPQGIEEVVGYSVREFISLARYPHLGRWGKPTPADEKAIEESLAKTQIQDLADRDFQTLSGGEKQKVLIASALAQASEILLLDEPTSHLDYRHQVEVHELLNQLQMEDQLTILKVTHHLNPSLFSGDQVLALESGKLIFSGAPRDLLQAGELERIYKTPFEIIEHPKVDGPILIPKGRGEQ